MGAANHAVLDATRQSKRGQIQTSMKLVRLHAYERQQSGVRASLEEVEIIEIGLNVLVSDNRLDASSIHLRGRHAPQVGHRAVGHESTPEPFDVPRYSV